MRTLTDATLFTVNGPHGCYYALRNHDTGAVMTERTESAAAALANEHDLVIAEQRIVSHAQLLEMMESRSADSAAAQVMADAVAHNPDPRDSGPQQQARRFAHRDPHASTTPS